MMKEWEQAADSHKLDTRVILIGDHEDAVQKLRSTVIYGDVVVLADPDLVRVGYANLMIMLYNAGAIPVGCIQGSDAAGALMSIYTSWADIVDRSLLALTSISRGDDVPHLQPTPVSWSINAAVANRVGWRVDGALTGRSQPE